MPTLDAFLTDVRACTRCAPHLPHGVQPVFQFHPSAPILIAGQAPGARVHASGVPFDDASGARLRAWLGVDRDTFYDPTRIAILPMGFCYPGTGKSGDLPLRPECAPRLARSLHAAFRAPVAGHRAGQLRHGLPPRYWQDAAHPGGSPWREHWPQAFPLPHPSPRNNRWLVRNPWFQQDVLPALQARVQAVLTANPKETP